MSEIQFGYKVCKILNRGAILKPGVVARLEAARELATSKQRVAEPHTAQLLVKSAQGFGPRGTPVFLWPRLVLPVVFIIAAFLVIQSWRQVKLAEEIEEIDAAVLTGDLPIDAYTDTGFDAWLKRSLP